MMGNVYKHTIVLPASSNNYAQSFITLFKNWILGLNIGITVVDEHNGNGSQSDCCSAVFSPAQQTGANYVVCAMYDRNIIVRFSLGNTDVAPNGLDSYNGIVSTGQINLDNKNISVVCTCNNRFIAIGFNHTIFSNKCLCFAKAKTLTGLESWCVCANSNVYADDGTLLGAQGSIFGDLAQDNADSIAVMANAVIKSRSTMTHYLTDVYSHLPNNMVPGCIYKIGNDDYYKDGIYLIKL